MTASARIDDLKKRYDENPRRFFAPLANEYRKAGDLDQAIALCQTHLAEQPSNMNGHVVFAQALYDAGRYVEAKATFETALTLDPENLIALRHLGDIACASGANDEAREWYERVLDADPRNGEIIALLAHLAADAKKAEVAASVVAPSRTTASDPTPIIPIEAVTTVRAPVGLAQAPTTPDVPGRSDYSTEAETPVAPLPAVASLADSGLDAVFADAEEIHFGTPPDSVPAVPVWPAPPANDESFEAHPDFAVDAFVEPAQAPEPPAEPFVTETMAELYLQQGFAGEALDVYRQLSAASPGDELLKERVRRLERGDRTPPPPDWAPSIEPEPVSAVDFAPEGEMVAELAQEFGDARDSEPEPTSWAEPVPTTWAEPEPMLSVQPEEELLVEATTELLVEPGQSTGLEAEPEPEPELSVAQATESTANQTPDAPVNQAPANEAPSSAVPTARSYFAALAARRAVQGDARGRGTPQAVPPATAPGAQGEVPARGLEELFAGSPIAPDDERIALAISQVAGAAEMGNAYVKGKPTAAAETELSLDDVFRESEPRAAGAVARQSETLRFDQFFAAAAEGSDARGAESAAPAGEPGSPAELRQFQSWLTRLKQP